MLGDKDDLVELNIGFPCQSSERLFKRSSSLFSVIPGRFSIKINYSLRHNTIITQDRLKILLKFPLTN